LKLRNTNVVADSVGTMPAQCATTTAVVPPSVDHFRPAAVPPSVDQFRAVPYSSNLAAGGTGLLSPDSPSSPPTIKACGDASPSYHGSFVGSISQPVSPDRLTKAKVQAVEQTLPAVPVQALASPMISAQQVISTTFDGLSARPAAQEDDLAFVECSWGEDGGAWLRLGKPGVRLEPNWKGGQWCYAAPVDFRGLDKRAPERRAQVDLVDTWLQRAEDARSLPDLPAPQRWRELDTCPIS